MDVTSSFCPPWQKIHKPHQPNMFFLFDLKVNALKRTYCQDKFVGHLLINAIEAPLRHHYTFAVTDSWLSLNLSLLPFDSATSQTLFTPPITN